MHGVTLKSMYAEIPGVKNSTPQVVQGNVTCLGSAVDLNLRLSAHGIPCSLCAKIPLFFDLPEHRLCKISGRWLEWVGNPICSSHAPSHGRGPLMPFLPTNPQRRSAIAEQAALFIRDHISVVNAPHTQPSDDDFKTSNSSPCPGRGHAALFVLPSFCSYP